MNIIEQDFRNKVCEQVNLKHEGSNRYRVLTPFRFPDGDHLSILLSRNEDRWWLTDEGHTYLHLTYDLDEAALASGGRQEIISNALAAFDVQEVGSELRRAIEGDDFGNALYSYIQALLKITDVTFLSRERVRSTFQHDLAVFLADFVPQDRLMTNWHHPDLDPEALYSADYRINGMKRPLIIYSLQNDDRTRDATTSLWVYESWGLDVQSLGIFEDQEQINRKVLARFTDITDRQFSSLAGNKTRIKDYILGLLNAS